MTLLKISHQEILQPRFLSDNLTRQHLIVTKKHMDVPLQTKRKCYFHKHFHNKNLKNKINLVDWEDFLQISKQNLNLSFELFNQKIALK